MCMNDSTKQYESSKSQAISGANTIYTQAQHGEVCPVIYIDKTVRKTVEMVYRFGHRNTHDVWLTSGGVPPVQNHFSGSQYFSTTHVLG